MSKKRLLKTFFVIMIIALCFYTVQFFRLSHRVNTFAKNEFKIALPARLSSPIESILDGYPSYIFLFSTSIEINEQFFNCYSFCNTYAREVNRLFFVSSLHGKAGSVNIPDDLILCEQTITKLDKGLSCFTRKAMSFERNTLDASSPATRSWLEKVLIKAKQFDSLIEDADLPSSIQTKDDVVSYLIFIRSLSDFAEEFQQTITGTAESQSSVGESTQENLATKEKKVVVGQADSPSYASLADLEKNSDYIIYGTVLSKSYEWLSLRIEDNSDDEYLNPGGDVDDDLTLVTVFEVSVSKSYKTTDNKSDVIKVLMIGGETEDTIYMIEGSPEAKEAEKYIFFLSESSIVENGAWLLNDTQSLYSTDGNAITSVTEGGFDLSFEELDKMIAE